tara:strand:+ start:6024 stop:6875 length:852 start_codon:yes stop_codon:yes gene_type:complete
MFDKSTIYKGEIAQLKKEYDNSLNEIRQKHYNNDELEHQFYDREITDISNRMNQVFNNIKDGLITDLSYIKLSDIYDMNKDNMKDIYYKEIDNLMNIKDIENNTTVNHRLAYYENKHIDFFEGLNMTLKKIYWLLIIIILIVGFMKKQYKNIKLYLFLIFILVFPYIVPFITVNIRQQLGYIKFTGFISIMFAFVLLMGFLLYQVQKLPFMKLNMLTLILGINKAIKEKPIPKEERRSPVAPAPAPVAPAPVAPAPVAPAPAPAATAPAPAPAPEPAAPVKQP